jgi:hypothetical protein
MVASGKMRPIDFIAVAPPGDVDAAFCIVALHRRF